MIGYSGESEPSESPGQFTLREVMIMMIVTSMIMMVIVILMIMMMIAILMIMM